MTADGEHGSSRSSLNMQAADESPARSCMERWLSPLTENGFRSGMLTLTTTALGGGVLSVAFVMNICGIALGCMILALGALLAYLGMAALMEMSTKTGCSSYAALFSHCAGHLAGPILDAFLFVYGNGACVGYMVFIGDFVPPVLALMFPGETWAQDTTGLSRTCCIAIAAVLLVPMMLPYDLSRLKFLQPVSIMALVYMAIVVAVKCPHSFSVNVGKHGYESIRWFTLSPHFFEAFALCVFAFNCHLNVVPIADQLVRPTVERTKKISIRVNLFQWLFYSLIGVTGYLSFLDDTSSDILTNYSPHDYFVAAGRCFLTLTMMVAIPANLNPTVRSGVQLKDFFCKRDRPLLGNQSPTSDTVVDQPTFRITVSIIGLACQAALAVVVPQVGTVLSLLGATVATAMMLIIPAYCMGVVLEKTIRRQIKQALLCICALVSFASVPFTVLEAAGVISKPP
ncbi:unnamed protein product [Durusdinium trenchii]|uniref:Amino acid transporter transmembrane domain-containing protein n=1 Tax=Durusdinium trenchii TaxID=1381693 RepID=A0ABP0RA91_9DINO